MSFSYWPLIGAALFAAGASIVALEWPLNGGETRGRLCDEAVAALLNSKDLVEVQRAGILVHELDCGISFRAAGSTPK